MNVLTFDTEAEWLEARRGYITSSDLPILLGLLDQVSPWQLWIEKVQGGNRDSEYWMRRGHWMEDGIAGEYERKTGRVVSDPGDFALVVNDWRAATLDRLTGEDSDGILEIKAPTVYGLSKYREGPDKYVTAQVQWQMLVTGLQFADVAVDMTTRLEVFRVNANPELQAALEREALRFKGYVDRNEPPPIDGHPMTAKAMADFFADPVEETVVMSAEARDRYDEMIAAKESVDVAKVELEECRNWFRRELGSAIIGNDPEMSIQAIWRPDKNGSRRLTFREIQR